MDIVTRSGNKVGNDIITNKVVSYDVGKDKVPNDKKKHRLR